MDGGYYAIKGFDYQIDKTIQNVLKESKADAQIKIEQRQDINSDEFVMQVKYKETQKFTPSLIREPVEQLIREFLLDKSKKYIISFFFGDMNSYDETKAKAGVEKLLSKKFTDSQIKEFSGKFVVEITPEFELQLENTIKEIVKLGYNVEEAIIHHSHITYYLRSLVTSNAPGVDLDKRFTTKRIVTELIKSRRDIIYLNCYRDYKGDLIYLNHIKREHFTRKNLDHSVNFILVEFNNLVSPSDSLKLINRISDKYVKFLKRDCKGRSPYIFFYNCSDSDLILIKKNLSDHKFRFIDGYNYRGAEFDIDSINKRATIHNKIKAKIVSDLSELHSLVVHKFDCPTNIYQFYVESLCNLSSWTKLS